MKFIILGKNIEVTDALKNADRWVYKILGKA